MPIMDVVITRILDSGTTFGVVENDGRGQNVFISGRLAETADLYIGRVVRAHLVPNPTHAERTPWAAVTLEPSDDDALLGTSGVDTTVQDILEDLEHGYATVDEIAEAIGQPDYRVRSALEDLVSAGRVQRFDTYGLPD